MTWGLNGISPVCLTVAVLKRQKAKMGVGKGLKNNAIWGLTVFLLCGELVFVTFVSVYSFIMKSHLVEADSFSQGPLLWTKAL